MYMVVMGEMMGWRVWTHPLADGRVLGHLGERPMTLVVRTFFNPLLNFLP